MCFVQRICNLRAQFDDLLQRQGTLLQPLRQRLTFDALHHQVIDAIMQTDIVQDANVRVIQMGDGLGFPLEALLAHGIRRELRGKNLDSDSALKPCILGTIHLSHPAYTQRRNDLIRTESCAKS